MRFWETLLYALGAVFIVGLAHAQSNNGNSCAECSSTSDTGLIPSEAALAGAATATYPNGVWRADYAPGNGAPPLLYLPKASCPYTSGNDTGACIASSDAKEWVAQFPASGPDIREWGAVGDGATDNTAALNAAAAWANATGIPLVGPGGKVFNYANTSPLTFTANGAGLKGQGGYLTLQGTVAAGDIVVFNGVGQSGGIGFNYVFSNISIVSNIAKTSGYAVHIEHANNTNFDQLILGQANISTNLYGGIYYDNSGGASLSNLHVSATNECVAVSSSIGNADLLISSSEIGPKCGNAGIHQAGGFGGLVVASTVDIFGPNTVHGLVVDNAYVAQGNPQLWFYGFVDTMSGDGVLINDTHGLNVVYFGGGGIDTQASGGSGHGINVTSCLCQFIVNGEQIGNWKLNGINIADTTMQLVLNGATQIFNNTQFGVAYTHAPPNGAAWFGPSIAMFANGSGNFNANSSRHLLTYGPAPAVSSCGSGASISGNDQGGTIATGSSVSSCRVTFAAPYAQTPTCVISARSSVAAWLGSISPTGFAIDFAASDGPRSVGYICGQYEN